MNQTPAPSTSSDAPMLAGLLSDLSHTLRLWRRSPRLIGLAILTLALGIGAAASLFSVVRTVLLNPLPYPDSDRMVDVWERNLEIGFPKFPASPLNFNDWREQASGLEHLAAIDYRTVVLTGLEQPRQLQAAAVSASYLAALGAELLDGRFFATNEEGPSAPRVVVASRGLAEGLLGGVQAATGKALEINGEVHRVIGVMPNDARGGLDLWLPLDLDVGAIPREAHFLRVIARLAPGLSLAQAEERMNRLATALAEQFPDTNEGWEIFLEPSEEALVAEIKPALLALQGAVLAVLLIACANVANLLLAQGAVRRRELTIRASLGAGRGRLVRQLLTESFALALVGAGLGLLLAILGVTLLVDLYPGGLPRRDEIGVDGATLLFTFALAVGTALICGLAPALATARPQLADALRTHSGDEDPRSRRWLRGSLVVAEVALALILLSAAHLLMSSFFRLAATDPGFGAEGLVTADIPLEGPRYAEAAARQSFDRRLLERVAALPNVEAAGTIYPLPLSGDSYVLNFAPPGRESDALDNLPIAHIRWASPGYRQALGISLLGGRDFSQEDLGSGSAGEVPVLVSRPLAAKIFPAEPASAAVGERLTLFPVDGPAAGSPQPLRIVGVIESVRHQGPTADPGMELYLPADLNPSALRFLAVRAGGDLGPLSDALRQTVRELDPSLPLDAVQPMSLRLEAALGPARFNAMLFGLFAGLALLLALIGVYGVLRHAVTRRHREIGIRLALGAPPTRVVRRILVGGLMLVGIGLVVGALASQLLVGTLESLLFGVAPGDPWTLLQAALALTAAGAVAAYLPARRAARVDPTVTLRQE